MASYLLESSAAVKLYVLERGSLWMTNLLDPKLRHELFAVRVTSVEVASAIFRRVRAGTVSPTEATSAVTRLENDFRTVYQSVEVTLDLADVAIQVAQRFGLRGYDCIQLAGAILTQSLRNQFGLPPLTLVSSDLELNAAARAEGFAVDDPNNHP